MRTSDSTTFELGETRLCLKDGLRFAIQTGRKGNWYLIEDESRSAFFRVGAPEYTFISMLDGNTTLSSAMAATCSLMGSSALSENDAINLCKWLVENGLANTTASTSAKRLEENLNRKESIQKIQKLNPISVRIPLFNPDKFIALVTRVIGPVISWPMAFVWIAVCGYALIGISMNWERVSQGSISYFSRDTMLWIAVTWLGLKFVHEMAHGIACRRFGGRVGSFGMLLLLLIPLPYVDVSSAWRFGNKYQRIFTSAAGMLAEIFVAAIAAIVWCHSDIGVVQFHAANIMIAASLHTLIFNANPLMRFDGYHILADWLELPNLGNHGQSFVNGLGKKIFFGETLPKLEYAGIHRYIVRAYGVASWIWKLLLCVVLGLAAANLLEGIGLLVALLAAVLWFAIPTWRFLKYLAIGSEFSQPNRIRFAAVTCLIAVILFSVGRWVPAPSVITAPAVIDFEPLKIVRAETSGFVAKVHVQPQQMVQKGDPLLTLTNRDLETRIRQTKILIEEARLRTKVLTSEGEIGALQIENRQIEAMENQLAELVMNQDKLVVRAGNEGMIVASALDELEGSYVQLGQELLAIGQPNNKEAIALVSQRDAKHMEDLFGSSVQLRIWGQWKLEKGFIRQVDPKSRDDLPHFSFAGVNRGPLDVVSRNQVQNEQAETAEQDLMLTQPRIQIHIALDEHTSSRLQAGQSGLVHLRSRTGSLGAYVIQNTRRWLYDKVTLNHGL